MPTRMISMPWTAAVESGEPQRWTQYLATLILTIGGFIVGTTLGWTSPAGPMMEKGHQYPFDVSEENVSWIGALMPLGALFGSLAMVGTLDKWGRKRPMVVLTVPTLLGWQLIIKAQSVRWIYAGRLLTGFSSGGYSVIVPLFISEIAVKEIRGTLGAYFQLQFFLGILYTYVTGSYFNVFGLSTACSLVPVVFLCLLTLVPESPIFHLTKGNYTQARRSLKFFRGGPYCDVDEELDAIQRSLAKADRERVPIVEAFKTTPAKRGLFLGLGTVVFQQFTGVNAVIFYATTIFNATGSNIEPSTSSIIVGVIAVASTYASTHVVDQQGRKILLLYSVVMMGVSTLLIGCFFWAKEYKYDVQSSGVGYVPLASMCTFIVMFSFGFGPVPWILISEIFPAQIKGNASSIVCMSNWFFAFLVTKCFISFVTVISIYNTFWLFTMFSVLGTFFVWFVVPETKGKTMEEIQVMLGAEFIPL